MREGTVEAVEPGMELPKDKNPGTYSVRTVIHVECSSFDEPSRGEDTTGTFRSGVRDGSSRKAS